MNDLNINPNIDFRLNKQYINGWYIYNYRDRIEYGVNGTSNHYTLSKKEYSLELIKNMILRIIFSTRIYI